METYHALTSIARSQPPTNEPDGHAITTTTARTPADEPEPGAPDEQPAAMVNSTLEELAREGARQMLERALAAEVDEFLGRQRYERRMLAEHGYRNGYGRPRKVAIGTWPVEVRAPRVRDLPEDAAPFQSSILPRRRMLSAETQRLFARLYLEGLSSGDFEPAFRELLGETAPLSGSTILRLKDEWASEYAAWRVRPLSARYAYIWADGIYLGAGIELENSCLLVVVGPREDGRKELLAMELGYRESAGSWATVLRDLRDRGLEAPLLACGDGALGLWAALNEVFPTTRHQRCWNHRVLNVLDKVPKNGCGRRPGAGCVRRGRPRAGPSASCGATRWCAGWRPTARCRRPRRSCATGTTSSPSTTSRPSTGSTCAPRTRSSRCSPASGCGPTSPSACAAARTRSTWCSRSPSASSTRGARSTVG